MRKSSIVLGVMCILGIFYFSYEIVFVFPKILTLEGLILNTVLVSAEILTAMFSIYLYHSIFCTLEWKSTNYKGLTEFPFVTIQVPSYNEPIETLKNTLESCMNLDYPKNKHEIIVADDSTDEKCLKDIKEFCSKHDIKLYHRESRRGFKAGALNDILKYSKGDIIALIDADDMPEKSFLKHSVETLMSSEKIAFVQTRNAERNDGINAITGIGRMVRDLFFGSILKSKDMRKLAIFCGSGGIMRRNVLKNMGGWPEDTVTEDIDISTKIFSAGLESKYINPIECRGLLPVTFTGLCGQTGRWAHGTTRTLKLRWKSILKIPGFWRKIEHLLSCATYLLGPSIILIDLIMVTHLLTKIPVFHIYEPASIWIFGVALTLSSFIALLFVQMMDNKISMKRIIAYILAIYGLSVNFSVACLKALLGIKFDFFRTPRSAPEKKNSINLIKRFWLECLIGIVSIYSGAISILNPAYTAQATWVIFFGIGFLSAPYLAARYG